MSVAGGGCAVPGGVQLRGAGGGGCADRRPARTGTVVGRTAPAAGPGEHDPVARAAAARAFRVERDHLVAAGELAWTRTQVLRHAATDHVDAQGWRDHRWRPIPAGRRKVRAGAGGHRGAGGTPRCSSTSMTPPVSCCAGSPTGAARQRPGRCGNGPGVGAAARPTSRPHPGSPGPHPPSPLWSAVRSCAGRSSASVTSAARSSTAPAPASTMMMMRDCAVWLSPPTARRRRGVRPAPPWAPSYARGRIGVVACVPAGQARCLRRWSYVAPSLRPSAPATLPVGYQRTARPGLR